MGWIILLLILAGIGIAAFTAWYADTRGLYRTDVAAPQRSTVQNRGSGCGQEVFAGDVAAPLP